MGATAAVDPKGSSGPGCQVRFCYLFGSFSLSGRNYFKPSAAV